MSTAAISMAKIPESRPLTSLLLTFSLSHVRTCPQRRSRRAALRAASDDTASSPLLRPLSGLHGRISRPEGRSILPWSRAQMVRWLRPSAPPVPRTRRGGRKDSLERPHPAPSSIPAPFFPTPFGIGTNAINPSRPQPRAMDWLSHQRWQEFPERCGHVSRNPQMSPAADRGRLQRPSPPQAGC